MPLARVVQSALPTFAGPGRVEADFEATVYRPVPTVTYASAVHVALVKGDVRGKENDVRENEPGGVPAGARA